MNPTERTDEFLYRHGLHPGCADFDAVKGAFRAEMRAGLSGEPSSLQMIPTYLAPLDAVRDGRTALTVDIGGTNLRIALVRASGTGLEIADSAVYPVPGKREEITKEAFLTQVAEKMLPYAKESETVGVCFSHSAEILPNRDGRLNAFSKEIRVTGAKGMEICRELSQTLRGMGVHTFKKFVLLNDTAAVLLSGHCRSDRTHDGLIGFVLGTGMNISYVEKAGNIKKAAGLFHKDKMVVNTEAGGFDKLPFGALDAAFFETTADPKEHRLEKITSGRYLGQLILFALQRAAGEGILSAAPAAAVLAAKTLTTPETSGFLAGRTGGGALWEFNPTDSDCAVFTAVIDRVYERAAKASAAAVAAILEATDAGRTAGCPAGVTAEGSTFYKLHSFREKFDGWVLEQIVRKDGRHMDVVTVENATILGTALAAMTQE